MFKSIQNYFIKNKIKYEIWDINRMIRYLETKEEKDYNERGVFDGFIYLGINIYRNRTKISKYIKDQKFDNSLTTF